MKATIGAERLDLAILARANAPSKRPPSLGELVGAIGSIAGDLMTSSELREQIARRVERLREAGLLDADQLRPTSAGEQRLADALGIAGRTQWGTVKNQVLVSAGLELDWDDFKVKKALKDAGKTRGAVLQRHYQLPTATTPTLRQAIDALVWRHLGVETDEPLDLGRLKAHVLRQILGVDARLDHEKLAWLAAAKATGASVTDVRRLRLLIARDWLTGAEGQTLAENEPARAAEDDAGETPPTDDLAAFARQVEQAAAAVPSPGRFGEHKVFISAAWRAFGGNGAGALDLDAFKLRLLDANRAGLVRLHRADLVGAMDPDLVRASEVAHLNATFHFIECQRKGG